MVKKTASAIVVFGCLAATTLAFAWSGECVRVPDGDDVVVRHDGREFRIRLYGIDCPEFNQPYGDKAKEFAERMVLGKDVEVEVVDCDHVHRRLVAWVSVGGTSVNKELLREGLAWWYRKYAPGNKELEALEKEAREGRKGLWEQENPVAPWIWKHRKR